eukprot:scaffold54344_cov87-Phaeocystis_antarctica.AAC.3
MTRTLHVSAILWAPHNPDTNSTGGGAAQEPLRVVDQPASARLAARAQHPARPRGRPTARDEAQAARGPPVRAAAARECRAGAVGPGIQRRGPAPGWNPPTGTQPEELDLAEEPEEPEEPEE